MRSCLPNPVCQYLFPLGCQHRLRVKLDASNVVVAMPQTHDALLVGIAGRYLKTVGQPFVANDPGVITPRLEPWGETGEDRLVRLSDLDRRTDAMIDLAQVLEPGPKGLANRLLTEADTQDALCRRVMAD